MNGASPDWIERFTAAHGRAPRILHVGNIANNAYQTAKMLNAAGADCDVLCADYYHIMGNPEWDDAEIEGDVGDQFFPALHKVNLNGFVRPRWFSQGPRHLAIAYLVARRKGQKKTADRLWEKMDHARRRLAEGESVAAPRARRSAATVLRHGISYSLKWLKSRTVYPRSVLTELFTNPALFALRVRQKLGLLPSSDAQALQSGGEPRSEDVPQVEIPRLPQWVLDDAKRYFPDRTMSFEPGAYWFVHVAMEYKELFSLYDIIQAYALDPIWPYLCGCQNYVAWEHGTLRDTPYEDNDRGRLTLLAYAAAKAVYVTNVDCYDSAVYITKHSGAPIVCGLHGFDTERMLQKQQAAQSSTFRREDYAKPEQQLFFCPARVDIDSHYGTYLKKNDMLYRALGRLYQQYPGQFKVLQLEWGRDTEALKAFISEECPGLEEAVVWRPPFQKADFYQTLQNCELVFDNFLLPLMGGNGIETLMSGHATLVNKRIPEELMLRFFPEMWPILAVEDEDDIYSAAKTALEDPAACRALAQKGREWILKYHSHAAIVQRNCLSYQLIIPMP